MSPLGSPLRPWPTLLLGISLFSASLAVAKDLYVSPTGDDTNPGTLAAPLKTLAKAKDAVREMNQGMTEDIHVYLRGGNYPIDKAIEFTPADGATGGRRIVYEAYGKEIPVLNGERWSPAGHRSTGTSTRPPWIAAPSYAA